ncbi:MBL fold metallo-hydrolase [Brevibacillus sp. NRS-1366]|uniref:MBL fold metallo-hydrolase n=1 Tax=Brevibacillus sp. NRS-1366 TaxID=3233899 RepID=UPI003D1B1790
MKYGRIIQKPRVKFFEVADDVFAGVSPYRGISWSNAGFINKGKGLVFDTFFDLFHAKEMREVFKEVSNGGSPAYVVNSHYNSDHTWGNKVFKDACIIMHKEAERERLTENITWMDGVIKRGKDSSDSTPGERFFAAEFEGFDLEGVEWISPNIEIKDDINIRLGETEVVIYNVAPAHSDSDLLLWMPKEKILFAGDIVFNGCTAYSEEGTLNWVKVLDRIINEIKPEVVIPGHGAICSLAFVQEQRDYLMNLISEFHKHYDDEIDPLSLTKKMDISRFLHWIQPERLFMTVDILLKSKRGLPTVANWNEIPKNLEDMRVFLAEKYGSRIKKWDPMSVWEE